MDKETIRSYLVYIKGFLEDGKLIRAYKELNFVIDNIEKPKPKRFAPQEKSD